MSKLVAEEYLSSLTDLTVNSKPLINMLTMLADENVDHAPAIVQVIESHLEKVPPEVKLPILYLIDSIIKNVSKVYVPLFTQNIVNVFVSVFEKVDERTRLNMYKLRQTWADVFPARKLYVLDLRVKDIDHAWPVTAPTPTSIHFNPKFLGNKSTAGEVTTGTPAPMQTATPPTPSVTTQNPELSESALREQLLKKQKILIELQQKKLELQLMQTKAIIEGQENQFNESAGQGNLGRSALLNEDAAKLISQRATLKPKAVVMPPSNTSHLKLKSAPNSQQNKTKIAPANSQLIEAAKSRDPRIAKQQHDKVSEVTHKEQEIYNRQLAMLKTPVVEQVAPVVPAQNVLGDSSVKSHITVNVQNSLEKERLNAKIKKQFKETLKNENSPKNKSRQNSSKEFKNFIIKNSKNKSSKESKNFPVKVNQRKNLSVRSKTPPKNERNVSPVSGHTSSPKNESKWCKESNRSQIKPHSSKLSPTNSPSKSGEHPTDIYSPNSPTSFVPKSASLHFNDLKKTHRKSRKKHKRTGEESPSRKESSDTYKKKTSLSSRVDDAQEPSRSSYSPKFENKEKSPLEDSKLCSKSGDKDLLKQELEIRETPENIYSSEDFEFVQNIRDNVDSKKDLNSESVMKGRESKKTVNVISLDLEPIESSPSPEPPPPPIISRPDDMLDKKDEIDYEVFSEDEKESQKEVTGFKNVKGVPKGRNYMRRNRELSASPKEIAVDIDHRVGGPPEKQARLLHEEKTNVIESKKLLSESLVNVSGKDVDFRLLTVRSSSPTKKRLPAEATVEEPPKKKNKSEIFVELFGSGDVDLRKITRGTLNTGDRLPSPPPPPVISNGPTMPQVAAIAPLVVGDNVKQAIGDDSGEFPREDQTSDNVNRDRDGFDSNRGRYRKSWADIKVKPEAEIKPITLSSQLKLELDQRKDLSYSSFDSSDKSGKKHFKDRPSPRGELDRLGRPLLYNKLPNDPRARRESLGVLDGRDTDMRRLGSLMDRDLDTNINVNMIIAQAADQVRNGTMSLQEYNELLKQVIQVNEKQKLREAQNKSRQEVRRSKHHNRNRRSPNRFGSQNRNSPPFMHDDERRDRRPFNDIDERLPMPWGNVQQHNNDSGTGFNRMSYSCGSNRTPFEVTSYDDRPIKSDVWDDDSNHFRRLNDFENSESRLRDVMCNERTHDCVDVPPADQQVLDLIAKDPMKSINIDGTARDIRFYGDTAVVMLSWDDPKEISFEGGIRRVLIGDISIVCALNDPYIMFMLNGNPHRIRLGAPTRELYIDGEFYEAYFGGPPVQVQIDGLPYLVQLEGPPPQVKIGKKRTDLICGRVNMIVDATAMLPLYLDAKPQRFDLKSRPYVFRLVNFLKTLLVNEVPVDIQFGGGCRQICGYGNLHFLRLSMLPNGVEPGRVQISNMESLGLPSPANLIDTVPTGKKSPALNSVQPNNSSADLNLVQSNFESNQQQQSASRTTGGGPLDILTSLISGTSVIEKSVGFNYQVENKDNQQPTQSGSLRLDTDPTTSQVQPPALPALGGGLNINDLFQRLVASGIVPTLSSTTGNNQKTQNEPAVKPIDFSDSNSLREHQPAVINLLYSGIQCSSCGVRFSPEETVKYSHHLDWHFRQNRREKDAARKGQSRKWYYDVSDWIQFEEIEDLEERAQSWFESEANNADECNEQEEVKSVPAPSGHDFTLCELCRDEFETYYNEEKEEWHLKPCILVEGKYYHPVCYEDLISMPDDSSLGDKTLNTSASFKEHSLESMQLTHTKEEEFPKSDEIKIETPISDIPDRESQECINLKLETVEECPGESKEDPKEVIITLLNELINCIVFKNELEQEEKSEDNVLEEENKPMEEVEDEEIEVLESVPVEHKKNIIDVDLIEKLDDEEDIVFHRKTPSPIVLIPPAKIKQEPVDEMESPVAVVDQTITNVVSSIDGNVEMIDAPQVAPSAPSRIKITFNKPILTEQHMEKQILKEVPNSTSEEIDPDPLPLKTKKPRIAEKDLVVYLPVVKGTEESGLCSIM